MPKARRHPECFKPDRAKFISAARRVGKCAKAVARCATRSGAGIHHRGRIPISATAASPARETGCRISNGPVRFENEAPPVGTGRRAAGSDRRPAARWRAGPVARPGSRMAPRSSGGIAGSPAGKSPSVVKRACEGDMTAARLILERIAPTATRAPCPLEAARDQRRGEWCRQDREAYRGPFPNPDSTAMRRARTPL